MSNCPSLTDVDRFSSTFIMKKDKKLNQRRTFSEDFKRIVVNEFESGNFTVLQLSRLHKLDFQIIYNWIRKYSKNEQPKSVIIEMKNSSTQKLKELEKQVKDLERLVGQKQINIEYLEKIIDLGSKHYKTDLKKSFDT